MAELDQNPAKTHFALLLDLHGMIQLIGSYIAFLSQQITNTDLAGT